MAKLYYLSGRKYKENYEQILPDKVKWFQANQPKLMKNMHAQQYCFATYYIKSYHLLDLVTNPFASPVLFPS